MDRGITVEVNGTGDCCDDATTAPVAVGGSPKVIGSSLPHANANHARARVKRAVLNEIYLRQCRPMNKRAFGVSCPQVAKQLGETVQFLQVFGFWTLGIEVA